MLLATHDLPLVRRFCSRVILMDQGRIVADRPTPGVLDDTALLIAHGLIEFATALSSRGLLRIGMCQVRIRDH